MLSACGDGGVRTVDLPGVRSGLQIPVAEQREPAPTERVPVLGEQQRELGVPDFAGDHLVVNFWASWCAPCRTEQPELNQAYEALRDQGVSFLGVDIQDSEANGLGHVREFDVPYPSLFDPSNAYAARYRGVGPRAIPSTIVIDPRGRVAARLFGATTAHELTSIITFLREERPGPA